MIRGCTGKKVLEEVANSALLLSICQPDGAEKQREKGSGNDISITPCLIAEKFTPIYCLENIMQFN